jgi:hypothetical protein
MATNVCDNLIKQNIAKNCLEPMIQGVERTAYIINRKDVDFGNVEFVEGTTNQISALPLLAGKKAYSIEQYGSTPYSGSSIAIAPSSQGGQATNTISLVVPSNSPAMYENVIDPLFDGEFLVIFENKAKGLRDEQYPAGGAFQIFGYWQGLTLAESTKEFYNDDTLGGFPITLVENKAPKSAMFLNAGSYEDTKALIQSLLVAAQ